MNLLIISPHPETYTKLEKVLSTKGFTAFHSSREDNFYALIRKKDIRVIIYDNTEYDPQDFSIIEETKFFDPLIEVIIVGKDIPSQLVVESLKLGARDFLVKPFDPKVLLSTLEKIKSKMNLRKATYQLEKELTDKYFFEGMVGKSLYMLEVFSLIEKVANYSTSVLITGETGTGKEMVAQAIHNLSPRREHKFIPCDCTAIPESLFESELFGYVRGAFTGAEKSKNGLLTEANKGTLFLDEIGEIPLYLQTKLLRVLEERQYRPLGSTEARKVDIQLISATTRDLRKNIKSGEFKEELFHRINVVEIELPPLREKKEDIPLLCRYFFDKYNKKFRKSVAGFSQRAQKILLSYSWPGNVRELENLIERAVMLSQERFIDTKDFPETFLKYMYKEEKIVDMRYPFGHLSLKELERVHILEILKTNNNNKRKAAKALGLTRQALYRKLKRLNIPY